MKREQSFSLVAVDAIRQNMIQNNSDAQSRIALIKPDEAY